jgi:hypothetical protein
MDPACGLPEDTLRTCMAVSLRGIGVPHWVVIHDVGGITAGIYRWPDLTTPVRTGALRDELHRVCLDQSLARDAAFVAIAAARRTLAQRPRVPRGAARRRAGRRPDAPGRVRVRRERVRDDVPG